MPEGLAPSRRVSFVVERLGNLLQRLAFIPQANDEGEKIGVGFIGIASSRLASGLATFDAGLLRSVPALRQFGAQLAAAGFVGLHGGFRALRDESGFQFGNSGHLSQDGLASRSGWDRGEIAKHDVGAALDNRQEKAGIAGEERGTLRHYRFYDFTCLFAFG
jgi:hypothetical protein